MQILNMIEATRSPITGITESQKPSDMLFKAEHEMIEARISLVRPIDAGDGNYFSCNGLDIDTFKSLIDSQERLKLRFTHREGTMRRRENYREDDIHSDPVLIHFHEALLGLHTIAQTVSWGIIDVAPEHIRGQVSGNVSRFEASIRNYWEKVGMNKTHSKK